MTYIPTWAGFGYLAVVLDVFSRKVVGFAFGQQCAHGVFRHLTDLIRIKRSDFRLAHSDSNQVRAGAAFSDSGIYIVFV